MVLEKRQGKHMENLQAPAKRCWDT